MTGSPIDDIITDLPAKYGIWGIFIAVMIIAVTALGTAWVRNDRVWAIRFAKMDAEWAKRYADNDLAHVQRFEAMFKVMNSIQDERVIAREQNARVMSQSTTALQNVAGSVAALASQVKELQLEIARVLGRKRVQGDT